MDKKKYQIFISSTYDDLIEVRKKVQETILAMYHFPIGMEMFSAGDDEQWEVIKDTIESSDYYIVIIGHRYGSETPEGISYTEKEYDYAKNKGIPILAFIRNRDISLRPSEREEKSDIIEKLNDFIEKAKSNKMCDFWEMRDDLASKVTVALYKQFNRKERPGWVRADNMDFKQISNELTKLSNENRNLRNENRNLRNENKDLKNRIKSKKPILLLDLNNGEKINLDYPKEYNELKHEIERIKYNDVPIELKKYVTEEEINKYNEELPSDEVIMKYTSEKITYMRIKNTGKYIEIKISNNGTVKANNVYIDIEFPKEILVMEEYEIEKLREPKRLELPVNPIKKAEREYNKRLMPIFPSTDAWSIKHNNYVGLEGLLPTVLNQNSNIKSRVENNIITIKLNSLLHTRQVSLEEKYKFIPLSVGEFKVNVSIICEEYEERIEYIVPITVDEIN